MEEVSSKALRLEASDGAAEDECLRLDSFARMREAISTMMVGAVRSPVAQTVKLKSDSMEEATNRPGGSTYMRPS
jgi:hypothetical protein